MDAIAAALQATSTTLPRRIATTGTLYALSDLLAQRVTRTSVASRPASPATLPSKDTRAHLARPSTGRRSASSASLNSSMVASSSSSMPASASAPAPAPAPSSASASSWLQLSAWVSWGLPTWWDVGRTARLALYGALLFAPLQSLWLGSVVEQLPLAPGAVGTLAKVALDQLTMSPLGLALFLWYTSFFAPLPRTSSAAATATATAGQSPRAGSKVASCLSAVFGGCSSAHEFGSRQAVARSKLASDFWPTLKSSWAVWVPVQVLTMGVVPPRERLLFVNLVALLWNAFLSLCVLFLFRTMGDDGDCPDACYGLSACMRLPWCIPSPHKY